ncbi:MAG TPA: type II toxin-antitoxin system prevent-host-death family antitoxin [Acidobacteriaceae bacterium]|jgi:antitoxin (DNA-binding transcriptional repressor) of toxin-antitoxin stability system
MNATIFEAKAKFSELVRRAQNGEEVIITSGREKTPVVEIRAIHPRKPQRIGFLKDLGPSVPNSFFFDPVPEAWTGTIDDPDDPSNWSSERIAAANAESDRNRRAEPGK